MTLTPTGIRLGGFFIHCEYILALTTYTDAGRVLGQVVSSILNGRQCP